MTTEQAAKLKGCSRQAILTAIWRKQLNAVKFGRDWNVVDDEVFQAYTPAFEPRERILRRWAKERARPITLGVTKGDARGQGGAAAKPAATAKAKKGGK
jgi:excisionase family DNA binding protein